MNTTIRKHLGIFLCFIPWYSFCQVSMADGFRSEGKIFVVLFIIMILLAGLFSMLIILDKKTKQLEKKLKDREDR